MEALWSGVRGSQPLPAWLAALKVCANYFAPLPSRFRKYHGASAFEEKKNSGKLPASLNSILLLPRRQVPPHTMDKAETFGAYERRKHFAASTNRYGLDLFVHVQLRCCFVKGSVLNCFWDLVTAHFKCLLLLLLLPNMETVMLWRNIQYIFIKAIVV